MSLGIVLAVAIGGYLLGSVSFARVVGRFVAPDLELESSAVSWGDDEGFVARNVSATTLENARGRRAGCLAGIFDILKAAVPVLALGLVWPDESYDVVAAGAIMAGHNFPIYYRFLGGRGTTTLLGALLVLAPLSIPVTIFFGYLIGLYIFRDVLLAHHAGWIVLLPVWFAILGDTDLVIYAVVVNVLRWSVSGPELKQWWKYRSAGVMQSEEFHDAIEQTHMGYVHAFLRKRGWIHYDYMDKGAES